ncbi:unnamed protein product [Didymodactylos carnosus]|uniref:Uncharacterized protein n=1 Tax=Didymodactylos carnosus TaxID=1234261 RepID=A0A8S2F3H1_9BILA|nr:unnamed protein product [Didymodactylos carnosus]CAF4143769.1 unnamed protein product [Didymodactylos carnosus]
MVIIMFVYTTTTTNGQQESQENLLKILSDTGRRIPFVISQCQLKYENCLLDVNDADKLDTLCRVYSRLRDCLLIVNQDTICLSIELKQHLQKMRQLEYNACGVPSTPLNTVVSSSASSSSYLLFSTNKSYSILFIGLYSILFVIILIYFLVFIIVFCYKKLSSFT